DPDAARPRALAPGQPEDAGRAGRGEAHRQSRGPVASRGRDPPDRHPRWRLSCPTARPQSAGRRMGTGRADALGAAVRRPLVAAAALASVVTFAAFTSCGG